MLFFSEYISDKYGQPLYRVPVDLPLSCPHRIKNSGKGCIYCPEDGARARHLKNNLDLPSQVKTGIEYVRKRYGEEVGLIAYFQSFTNTNAPLDELKNYYDQVLKTADFQMMIISTRPDCLADEILDYLSKLNEQYNLWVELGVQTANNRTLELINRQHDFQCVKDAVAKLSTRKIKTAAHVILGLPGEEIEDFRHTAGELAKLPLSGIKIHNLLVLKNTPLASIYHQQQLGKDTDCPQIIPMNEYEYAEALGEFIRLIPEEWPLMRITADAPKEDIIAPKWWMKKGQFIEFIRKQSLKHPTETRRLPRVKTRDGSYTLYHPEYRQHFHSLAGAQSESEKKFLEPSQIIEALKAGKDMKILDIGFGLGINALTAIKTANEIASAHLSIVTLEKDHTTFQIAADLDTDNSILSLFAENRQWSDRFASIKGITGDARQSIQALDEKFDVVFLDPFSPDANPELWTYDFTRKIASLMNPEGVIVTYSAAFPVRGAMIRCGLYVGETPSFGRKKGGTIASFAENRITTPLSQKEMNIILKSTTGTPLRDPAFFWTKKEIMDYRKKLVQRLQAQGVPKWFKG